VAVLSPTQRSLSSQLNPHWLMVAIPFLLSPATPARLLGGTKDTAAGVRREWRRRCLGEVAPFSPRRPPVGCRGGTYDGAGRRLRAQLRLTAPRVPRRHISTAAPELRSPVVHSCARLRSRSSRAPPSACPCIGGFRVAGWSWTPTICGEGGGASALYVLALGQQGSFSAQDGGGRRS
jgi:hypothetical protein